MTQSVSISSAIGQPKIILRVPGIAGPPGSGGAGGVTDGDKGDITVSGAGLIWLIDADVVDNAKLANMASGTIKARVAAGSGDPQDATASEIRTLLNVEDGAQVNVGTDLSYTASSRLLSSSTGADAMLPEATTSLPGLQSAADKTKLDGIAAGAQVNVPTDLSYTASTRLLESSTGTDVTLPEATTTVAGLMSGADKTKLNGVETGAQVNVATDLSYTASTRLLSSSTGADVNLPQATTTVPGLQSAADKTKLDGIEVGAQVNVGTDLSYTASSRLLASSTGAGVTLPEATTAVPGLQSAADKTKLNGIETGAQVNVGTDLSYTASTRLLASSTGTDATLPEATTTVPGLQSAADKTKLDGIASGATANATDAQLRDRATHTGTQGVSTVTGLGGAATLNVGTTTGTVAAGDDSRITGALSATAAAATYQPLDSDLTAIAALTTATFGRELLTQADAAATRTTIGAGTSNVAISSATPQPLGTAAAGATGQAADAGHVHASVPLVSTSTAGLMDATDKAKLNIAVVSDVTGVTGADAVVNIISLTQAEYDAIVAPDAATLYVITD